MEYLAFIYLGVILLLTYGGDGLDGLAIHV
jgi:hypothetical protein